jgi:hypothetical protein
MYELTIISTQARDLVGAQFEASRDARGPADARRVRPARRRRPRSA